MKVVIKSVQERWRAEDWLLFLILLFQDVGTMGVFPLNFFQILFLVMLVWFIIRNHANAKDSISIPRNYLLCIGCIIGTTFSHVFDMESVKSVGYFALQLLAIILYLQNLKSYQHMFDVIYKAGLVLAVYGVIQEVGFLLGIPEIYDITRYGFIRNGEYVVSFGFLRAMSLYSEPSHVAYIISISFLIGMTSLKKKKEKKSILGIAIICIYAFFTLSLVVWMCFGTAIFVYIFLINKGAHKKAYWLIVAAIILLILFIARPDFFSYVFGKLYQFQRLSTSTGNDLSALAVVSNLRVAWAKNVDGYILGTGFDSSRLYYDQYIGRFYSNLVVYLNRADGASFYIRVLSEFGIVGLTVFGAAVIYKMFKAWREKDTLMLSFLVLYLVFVLRNGNYVYVVPAIIFAIIFVLPLNEHRRLAKGVIKEYELFGESAEVINNDSQQTFIFSKKTGML